jgi:hypothetical protein
VPDKASGNGAEGPSGPSSSCNWFERKLLALMDLAETRSIKAPQVHRPEQSELRGCPATADAARANAGGGHAHAPATTTARSARQRGAKPRCNVIDPVKSVHQVHQATPSAPPAAAS